MNTNDLVAFLRIADLHSVSAAARSLGAPKSSVSRSLARLEARAGVELIGRTVARLALTDAGEILYSRALRILAEVRDAEAALEELFAAPRGLVRVCAAHTFAHAVIAPMLPRFLRRYPEVQVAVQPDNGNRETFPDGTDVLIHRGPIGDASLVARRLPAVDLWVCASPSYLCRRGAPTSVQALYEHDIVDREPVSTWAFAFEGRTLTFRAHARAITVDATVTSAILENGFGIGRLPEYLARTAIKAGGLQRVLLDHVALPKVDIMALHPSHGSLAARVRAFLDALASQMAEGDEQKR